MIEVEAAPLGSELRRRLVEMAATNELLTQQGELVQLLRQLAERARVLTDADFAAMGTFAEDGSLSRFIYMGMDPAIVRLLGNPPVGRGLLGALARTRLPIRLADVTTADTFTGWPKGHPDMGPFLGIPVRAQGRTIGSLYMTRNAGREPFTASDELAAAMLALQAAAAVAMALAHERLGRLALLEERERIAHDLHDGTIQMLYALGLECDALAAREDVPPFVREQLEARVVRINQTIADIRNYISMLEAETPSTAPELSRDLPFVIRQLVPPGVHTVVNITAPDLNQLTSREVEDLLYIGREALSNAVRHSGASKIAVDLRQSETETALTIQDNGVGFDASTVRTGLGTITMRTRAERLGAALQCLAIPGMGVTVRVSVPRRTDD